MDTLLNLAEQGHYNDVMNLFNVPIKHCPDVLFLGLLQCKVFICHILFSLYLHVLIFILDNLAYTAAGASVNLNTYIH